MKTAWNNAKIGRAYRIVMDLQQPFVRKVIDYLRMNPGATTTEVYIKMRTDQSMVSQTLTKLRRHGLLTSVKFGKHSLHSINPERYEQIARACHRIAE